MSDLLQKLGQDSVEQRNYLSKMDARKLEKWERVGLLEGVSRKNKPQMARILENQAVSLLKEASETADISGFQAIALPMVRRVFGNLLAQEIVSVQPMSLPAGLVFWLDFTFGTARAGNGRDDWTAGGSVYGDPISPLTAGADGAKGHYDLHNSYTQRMASGAVGIASSGSATWANVDYDPTLSGAVADGTLFTVTVDLSENAAITNIDTDNYKSFVISGTVNSDVNLYLPRHSTYDTSTSILTMYYTGSQELDSGSAVQAAYVKKDAHFASTSGSNVNPAFEYAFDSSNDIPTIDIKVASHPIVADSRKLKVEWTPEVAQDLNAYHTVDAEAELTQIMADQVSLDIDSEILQALLNGAATKLFWDRRAGFFVNPADGAPLADQPSFTGNQQEWYRTLLETVLDVSNTIHRKNLRSGANFMVTSPDVCTILESLVHWRPVMDFEDPSQVKYSMGIEKVANLANRFTVYKNPFFPRNKILLGYKGDEWLTTGFVYAPYIPLIVTPTIYEPDNFTPRKAVMTRYATQLVRGDYYGVVVVKGMGLF